MIFSISVLASLVVELMRAYLVIKPDNFIFKSVKSPVCPRFGAHRHDWGSEKVTGNRCFGTDILLACQKHLDLKLEYPKKFKYITVFVLVFCDASKWDLFSDLADQRSIKKLHRCKKLISGSSLG
jgi:hypothetical protein